MSPYEIIQAAAEAEHGLRVSPRDPAQTRSLAMQLRYIIKKNNLQFTVKQGIDSVLIERKSDAET